DQLVLGLLPAALPVDRVQLGVGVGPLRVVVAPAHVGVGGRGVLVPPVLLGVLPMVAATAGEAEHALLEDRVLAVPQRQGEAERLPFVADAGHAVLVPPVGAGPGVVVREVVPGGAVLAVVLPHRPPGAFSQVRSPGPPRLLPGVGRGQPRPLRSGPPLGHSPIVASRTHPRRVRSGMGGVSAEKIRFGTQVCGDLATGTAREWLVTDGRGGYAMGTVSGLRTRRYHGLLVVAGDPPARRHLGLAALDPVLRLPSGAAVRLATHEWASGVVDPAGYAYLERFDLADGLPRWRWRVGTVVLEREVA